MHWCGDVPHSSADCDLDFRALDFPFGGDNTEVMAEVMAEGGAEEEAAVEEGLVKNILGVHRAWCSGPQGLSDDSCQS